MKNNSCLSFPQAESGLCVASAVRERVILSRKEGESSKCLNELLMSRMSRFRTSHSATLAALTGSAITNPVKEEQTGKFTDRIVPIVCLDFFVQDVSQVTKTKQVSQRRAGMPKLKALKFLYHFCFYTICSLKTLHTFFVYFIVL